LHDFALRNHEVGVVNVELHRLEEVLYALLLCSVPIDEVFARSAQHDLSGYRYLGMFLKADRALRFVAVVEYDCNARFGDTGLSALVDEILYGLLAPLQVVTSQCTHLQVLRSHHTQVVYTEDETY
jgi:hypothetical protein